MAEKSKPRKTRLPDVQADLRRRVEGKLRKQPGSPEKIPPADMQSLIHELRMHQVELEMQNEELRHTQQELQTSREKYFALYDMAPVGYVTLSEKGLVLEANLTIAAMLGTERIDLVRQPLSRFIFREDQNIYYLHLKHLFETHRHQECELRMLKVDGTLFWARIVAAFAKGNNDELASRTTISDITRGKRAEDELGRYREKLENMVRERTTELTAANEQLESFNYSVSHDLRAPLRHMRGFFEFLQKRTAGQLDEKSRHYSDMIWDALKKMESLIDALLSFSRLAREQLQNREVNLSKLLKETIEEILAEVSQNTNKRDIIWKIGELPNVYGEPTLLKLALVNLISNAVKFTSTRPRAEIEIGYKKEKDEFIFFVRDNGVGFNMDYSDRLFGLFQRFHTQDEFEGTGVGLANFRRIISRHCGRVWAKSEVGQGTTFYFTLPKREA